MKQTSLRAGLGLKGSARATRRASRQAAPAKPGAGWRRGHRQLESLEARVLLSTSVTSYHNNLSSTGQNLTEVQLTPANVNVSTFAKQFSTAVDGQVYAQPLYVPGVSITSGRFQGTHDVAYVATEHDSLYAIDAHGGTVLWQVSFTSAATPGVALTNAKTITSVPNGDLNSADINPEVGITGTPTIDPSQNALFVITETKQITTNGTSTQTHYVAELFKIDIQSGSVIASTVIGDTIYSGGGYTYRTATSPTAAQDPFTVGTGAGAITVNGQSRVYFNAMRQMSRPGVVLSNGHIYTAWASHGDNGPYHGWILGFDENTLAVTAALNLTPHGSDGGIWQGGGIAAVDSSGNFYFETGNGTFDGNVNSSGQTTGLNAQGFPISGDYGDSFVKVSLDPTSNPGSQNINGWGMKVTDYFAPFNNHTLDGNDRDLGSGGPMLLPDALGSAAHPHLLVGSGKEGKIYLIDRDNMGKFDPNTDHIVQEQGGTLSGVLNTAGLYFDGTTWRMYYVPGYNNDTAKAYTIANGAFSTSAVSHSSDTYGYLPGSPSISANGTTNGIVWAIDTGSNTLRAYNATNLGTELWTSAQAAGGRDALGTALKFSVPTVADGEVLVGTSNALVVYGPPIRPTSGPAAPSLLTATSPNFQTVNLTWQDNANNEDYFSIQRSTDNVNFAEVGRAGANAQSYTDTTNLLAQTTYSYRVLAHNAYSGSTFSDPSNTAMVTTPQAPPIGTGDGAAAAYYNDTNGNHLVDPAALVRVDPQINNNWGNGGPGAPIGVDNFSARWTGRIQAQYSETYTFYTESDDGVRFYIKPTASSTYTTLIDDWTDHGPTEDTGTFTLSAGQFYDFKMEYYELTGGAEAELLWSSPSTTKTAIPQSQLYSGAAPTAPTGLTAVAATGTQFNLSWTDKSGNENGFLLQRVNPDTTLTNISLPPNTTSYMDNGLTPDTQYTYRLQATNFAANSAFTPDLTVTTPIPPPQPSNARAAQITTTTMFLAWQLNSTKPSNTETGVAILRETGTSGFFKQIATLAPGTTSYQDSGLTPGTEYDYHIQAYNVAGYSDFTGIHTATIAADPSSVQAAPADGQVTLTWTPPPYTGDAQDLTYNVYRGTSSLGEGAIPVATDLTSPTFTDTGLADGTTYYYQVTAVTLGGESDASSEASATPVVAALAITVGDGSAQRSEVTSLTVKFTSPVTLQDGAITLSQRTNLVGPGAGVVPVTVSNPSGDGVTWLVTFPGTSGPALDFASLADGVYDLTVHASLVSNGPGAPAGSAPPLAGDATYTFHRLFGDLDGNKTVNALDYALFKQAFGSATGDPAYNSALDFDGNGAVNALDYAQFKKRFGASVVY